MVVRQRLEALGELAVKVRGLLAPALSLLGKGITSHWEMARSPGIARGTV